MTAASVPSELDDADGASGASGADEPEPQRHLGYLIRRAQQLHVAAWGRIVSPEISSVQYTVLVVLDRYGEASQRELCDQADLDRSTIADLVARMERRGLIVRRRSTADARRNVVSLTPHGAAERRRLAPLVAQVQVELAADMPAEQLARLRADLKTLLARPS
nr:MarR family winged helix-turn-helix transcriptional regulator [Microbacterium bovistercoris]